MLLELGMLLTTPSVGRAKAFSLELVVVEMFTYPYV
jgi:hypothetical protein